MALSKITNASIGEAISVSNMPTGSVIQTVSASLGNDNVTTSTSYVDTGLTADITPIATSSKVLVTAYIPAHAVEEPGTDVQVYYQCLRASTVLGIVTVGDHTGDGSRSDIWTPVHMTFVDSPSSTSALTYKVQHKSGSSGWTSTAMHANNVATIVLQEIAG